jgi:hypothetical protein
LAWLEMESLMTWTHFRYHRHHQGGR